MKAEERAKKVAAKLAKKRQMGSNQKRPAATPSILPRKNSKPSSRTYKSVFNITGASSSSNSSFNSSDKTSAATTSDPIQNYTEIASEPLMKIRLV